MQYTISQQDHDKMVSTIDQFINNNTVRESDNPIFIRDLAINNMILLKLILDRTIEKSPNASRVLQLMDQDHTYNESINIVLNKIKNELEKELDLYQVLFL